MINVQVPLYYFIRPTGMFLLFCICADVQGRSSFERFSTDNHMRLYTSDRGICGRKMECKSGFVNYPM